jgi:hypothetical protein
VAEATIGALSGEIFWRKINALGAAAGAAVKNAALAKL